MPTTAPDGLHGRSGGQGLKTSGAVVLVREESGFDSPGAAEIGNIAISPKRPLGLPIAQEIRQSNQKACEIRRFTAKSC
ncbi:MAG: hypothetical protein KF688_10760 [Pirellulales bacterium]|nr:hypothetical protein [Pirellulales bacterium]